MVTSREEGGPLALLEAPAAEVPLLTTNVGMAPDILNHEHNALIVPVEDREALLQAALRLMNEKDLTAKIINNANKMVLNYDWDQLIDQYINLYKTLVSARASKNR
jgi:glycosyltransferase involved in cell wall biosynthesis